MRRAAAIVLSLVVLAACGSSSKSGSPTTTTLTPTAQGRELINQACIKYAQTILSTDPKSGIPQMSVSAAAQAYTDAGNTALSASKFDPQWKGTSTALYALASALASQDNAGMQKALPEVRAACNPVIAAIAASTTTVG
jgi:hypothetical protein